MTAPSLEPALVRIPDLHPRYRDVDLVVASCLASKRTAADPVASDAAPLGTVLLHRVDEERAAAQLLPIHDDEALWETLRNAYLGNRRLRATPAPAA